MTESGSDTKIPDLRRTSEMLKTCPHGSQGADAAAV